MACAEQGKSAGQTESRARTENSNGAAGSWSSQQHAPGSGCKRCAIYTRKSTEEGLEQDFNSLHAQREACAAYIASQRHEGWLALAEVYDDGGFSGGSMERPALARLLADIQSGRIDVVVVYKVDRLTRSLTDFARIVETFDQAGASFVSVTQSFNTTTSMGRLTLNVLLSFAQFEREVTGERIRDKIAASKRKGMWMGGPVRMGYLAEGRTLRIDEASASLVQGLFTRYLGCTSIVELARLLKREGVMTRAYVSARGKRHGGKPIGVGHLRHILSNPLYVGEIVHKGECFVGQHPALIDSGLFAMVQAKLASASSERICRTNARSSNLLAGLLIDAGGHPFISSHANKSGRRYRYYVQRSQPADGSLAPVRLRLPAEATERCVVGALIDKLNDAHWRKAELAGPDAKPDQLCAIEAVAVRWVEDLSSETPAQRRRALIALMASVEVGRANLRLRLNRATVGGIPIDGSNMTPLIFDVPRPAHLPRRGLTHALASSCGPRPELDRPLIKAIARAVTWYDDLVTGKAASVRDIAAAENVSEAFVGQHLRLALLAPDLIAGALEGAKRLSITTSSISRGLDIPSDWQIQRQALVC